MSDKVIEGNRLFVMGEQPALNGEIQKLVNDSVNSLKYSFLAAAEGQDTPFSSGSVEEEFRKAILTRQPDVRTAYLTKARQVVNAPVQVRRTMFGRYGDISVEEFRKIGFAGLSKKFPPLAVDLGGFKEVFKQPEKKSQTSAEGKNLKGIKLSLPSVKALRFYVTEVKCVDETDPETTIFGININDEILMGGLSVDPLGNVKKINPFLVRDDFNDGVVKVYPAPGKEFCGFNPKLGKHWPKSFAAIVYLAEEDWGGFVKGLTNALEAASPFIKSGISEAGDSFGIVGSVFAKIVIEIVDGLIEWILDLFSDDLFPPGLALAGLHTPVALVYKDHGGWKNFSSELGKFTFVGHGGVYTIKCQWKIEVTDP